ncbi:MAG: serine hydrolase [Bacteroidota bacterium]
MTRKNSSHFLLTILFFVYLAGKEVNNEVSEKTVVFDTAQQVEDYRFSTLIAKNGKIVSEAYHNGKTKDSLCNVQSLTKGIMSVLIGIALDKGFIKNIDESIANYLPEEFETIGNTAKRAITVRHILNQTSGLSWKGYLEHEKWLNSKDPILFVLNKNLENTPGTRYNYNSGATHLLSVILTRATGKTTLEFANTMLFGPLAIKHVDWERRNKGYYDGSGLGLSMKPIDLMKIGQLLANQGYWKNSTIVAESWVEQLFDADQKSNTTWGLKGSKHGFCWYKSKIQGDVIDYGMGYGGQFILMIPEKELIIVTTHNHDTPNGIEQQVKFLNERLPKLITAYGS